MAEEMLMVSLSQVVHTITDKPASRKFIKNSLQLMKKWVGQRKADLTSVANPDPCLSDPWIRDPGRVKNQDADPEPGSSGISERYRET
jgi:hypothetical protein